MRYTLEQVKQAQAKRPGFIDDPVTALFYRKISRYFTWLLAPTGVRPEVVCLTGFLICCVGVGLFATGEYLYLVIGMLIVHLGSFLDCSDGEIARLTKQESLYGKWLDLTLDATLEFLTAFALIWGLLRGREQLDTDTDTLLIVGFICILATGMMFFSIAWSAFVFQGAVADHEKMKEGMSSKAPRFLLRIHPKLFTYSGDMRKAILTVFIVANEPFWYLAFNGVVGNLYWMARLWVYRKR